VENELSRRPPNVAIIGGSGIYDIQELERREFVHVDTKFGRTSDAISVGEYQNVPIAFLPRHGSNHTIPPHRVPYKANIAALVQLGVRRILATCVSGSLKAEITPGSFVIPDQFVNLTWGRDDEFDAEESFLHLPMANPYCPRMMSEIANVMNGLKVSYKAEGTVVVIQGPRFSTRAESEWFARQGWDIVNMTQYPECYFARELGVCYNVLASVTDYDVSVGSEWRMGAAGRDAINQLFWKNIETQRQIALAWAASADVSQCMCTHHNLRPYFKK
jgi:5'-methylthioadenosine phosphorylase